MYIICPTLRFLYPDKFQIYHDIFSDTIRKKGLDTFSSPLQPSFSKDFFNSGNGSLFDSSIFSYALKELKYPMKSARVVDFVVVSQVRLTVVYGNLMPSSPESTRGLEISQWHPGSPGSLEDPNTSR